MGVGVLISVGLTAASFVFSKYQQDAAKDAARKNNAKTDSVTATAGGANEARALAIRQSVPPRRFVYGDCRVGGVVFFEDNANPYLYVGCALSDGPIDAVTGVYFGGDSVPLDAESPAGQATSSAGQKYHGHFALSYRLGTDAQTGDALLAGFSGAPADLWQRGVACAVVRLHWGADAAAHNALWGNSITPSFSGRFRMVYDPRPGTQTLGTESTYTYSDNPALCVAHALTNAWGIALPTAAVDWTAVGVAATACDATTTYDGATVPIFTLAGLFMSETNMAGQIQEMLDSFRGAITFSDGLYKIKADVSRTSLWTVTDDDILEIGDYTHAATTAEAYNAIKAGYFDKGDAGLEAVTTPYEDATAVAAEGLRETAIRVPFCPANHSAQILAYRKLKEIRNGRRLTLRLTDAALFLDPFEVITVASVSATLINGTWQIDQVDLADEGVLLTMREYVSALYDNPTTYLDA